MTKIFKLPLFLAKWFNKIPRKYRHMNNYNFYFSDGEFSCFNYKDFSGWYWANKSEFFELIKYQLKRILLPENERKEN